MGGKFIKVPHRKRVHNGAPMSTKIELHLTVGEPSLSYFVSPIISLLCNTLLSPAMVRLFYTGSTPCLGCSHVLSVPSPNMHPHCQLKLFCTAFYKKLFPTILTGPWNLLSLYV